MKRFFICILFLPLVSIGQSKLPSGIGILNIDVIKLPTLKFYNDTSQTKPLKVISVINKNGKFGFKNQDEVPKWFKPERISFYEDNDILIIRVDTVIGNWFSIYINDKGEKLWVKKDINNKYYTWANFFKNKVSNITKGLDNLEIKQSSNDSSRTIKKIEKEDCFEVLEVKGEWMKIRTHSILECSTSKRPIKIGWLKWRQKDMLTIKFGMSD